MRAGLLDEAHIVISPILLGGGERLFDNLGESLGRYRCTESVGSGAVTHVRIAKAD
jgi:dihydrofolate reductase